MDYEGFFTKDFKHIIGTYFSGDDMFQMDFEEPAQNRSKPSIEERSAIMFGNFRSFFTNQASLADDLADFTIVCTGSNKAIKSHRLILASQSKFFEGFFRRETKDTVNLDFKEAYVRKCINYMVTGGVDLELVVETGELEGVLEVSISYLLSLCISFPLSLYISYLPSLCIFSFFRCVFLTVFHCVRSYPSGCQLLRHGLLCRGLCNGDL